MSFWSDVEAEIASEARRLEAQIIAVLPFVKQVVAADAKSLGAAALQAVIAQAPLLISGQEKMAGALSAVGTSLAASGKAVGLADAQIAIQAAYNQLGLGKAPAVSGQ